MIFDRPIEIEGWTIRVEPALESSDEWPKVRREIENQLYRIARTVPDFPLKELRKVTIWVNRNDPLTACAAYHPSADWLREHGGNVAMAKGIQIGNATHFVSWTYEQPWMLLHELAHAYQDRVLPQGFANAKIKAAYDRIVKGGRYESVLRYNGEVAKSYALTNPMEFFAESTEAYFGQNDFFPFVQAELKTFDPETYNVMVRLWGAPQKRGASTTGPKT